MSVIRAESEKNNILQTVNLRTVTQTCQLAGVLARQCQSGDCILLQGEVGAGKTTFARAFIQALTATGDDIVSPTFTIVQAYPLPEGIIGPEKSTLWHFDLYRLQYVEELLETGLEEALESDLVLVEWPDIARDMLPDTALELVILQGKQPEERNITLKSAHLPFWNQRLDFLKEYAG